MSNHTVVKCKYCGDIISEDKFSNYNETMILKQDICNICKSKIAPCCNLCGTPMINVVDSISGELSPYLWKLNCEHDNGFMILSRG